MDALVCKLFLESQERVARVELVPGYEFLANGFNALPWGLNCRGGKERVRFLVKPV
jgi:hypothetical protein